MKKQLNYDFYQIILQKKFSFVLASIAFVSLAYAIPLVRTNLSAAALITQSLMTFRPICWLVCCGLISELLANDYRYKMLKTKLPYVATRASYLLSKLVVAVSVSFLVFFLQVMATIVGVVSFTSDYKEGLTLTFVTSFGLGVLSSVLLLVSLFLLVLVITENEVTAIGFLIGSVLLLLMLEMIEPLANYLPTLWPLSFTALLGAGSATFLLLSVASFIATFFIVFLTIKIFRKRDLFL